MLQEHGIEVTVDDYVIVSGSYEDESGGIFSSEGSIVHEADIDGSWFDNAWDDKKGEFKKKRVDFDLDFDDLPDPDSSQGNAETPLESMSLSGEQDNSDGGEAVSDGADELAGDHAVETSEGVQGESVSIDDIGVDSVDFNYADFEETRESDDIDFNESIASPSDNTAAVTFELDEGQPVELGDLISAEDDLLSDGDAQDADSQERGSDIDSAGLDEHFRLDLDDGETGEPLD
jgi:hypothetical protein